MNAPRTYRGWQIDFAPVAGMVASNADLEETLWAVDDREIDIAIDDFMFDLGDGDIATIQAAADALRSLAKRHGLTYACIGFHDASHGAFWAADGHSSPLVRHGTGKTVADAIAAMLASTPFDTSKVEKAA